MKYIQSFLRNTFFILFVFISGGCLAPRYEIGFDEILQREGKLNPFRYTYRCSSGAHRGASNNHKENTMAALRAANKSSKYAFIEFDVQYSQDKKIVIFHDTRMLRLFGSTRKIGNTTFDTLSKVSDGEIALYNEVMDVLHKKINIEIKSQGDLREDRSLADEIIADLKARRRDKDVLISSISKNVITYINEIYPDIATGQIFWLTSSAYLPFDKLTEWLYKKTNATQADYLILHVANLRNSEDLLKLKPKNKTLIFWDFDDAIYLVHKDLSDRMWGDSGLKNFSQFMRYAIVSPFIRFGRKLGRSSS